MYTKPHTSIKTKWFGLIHICIENNHQKKNKPFGFVYRKQIKVLGIPDHNECRNAALKEILKDKLQAYL
jgi:predicted protein tyrosine phosphatase